MYYETYPPDDPDHFTVFVVLSDNDLYRNGVAVYFQQVEPYTARGILGGSVE